MNIVQTGNIYRIFDECPTISKKLPVGTYHLCFSKLTGTFLEKIEDIKVAEKVYGVHPIKVDKILKAFERTKDRNLGVILSGDKGIGKSITAKLLAAQCIKSKIPVIVIDEQIPGMVDFLNKLTQEVMVLMDEFDKTFKTFHNEAGDSFDGAQTSLLSLFDGLSQGKKLYVITCNQISSISEYLVNRPGRFHYHLRFNYPTREEIKQYLEDKLDKKYWKEIDKVQKFSGQVNLNYDCLRAIAQEINVQETFEEAMSDLNITKIDQHVPRFNVVVELDNGVILKYKRFSINLYACNDSDEDDDYEICLRTPNNDWTVYFQFDPEDIRYDTDYLAYTIDLKNLKDLAIYQRKYYVQEGGKRKYLTAAEVSKLEEVEGRGSVYHDDIGVGKAVKIRSIVFKRQIDESIHY